MKTLCLSLIAVLAIVSSHNPHTAEQHVFTIVTALLDSPDSPLAQQMDTLKLMMTTTNFNFYVLIHPDKLPQVPLEVRTKRIIFIDPNTTALGEVWLEI
jgi:hypothetical protein